jgi:hypothetical protein
MRHAWSWPAGHDISQNCVQGLSTALFLSLAAQGIDSGGDVKKRPSDG